MAAEADMVVIGQVAGPHGVRGFSKLISHTDPRENLLDYERWWIKPRSGGDWREVELAEARVQGKSLVGRLLDCEDRNAAEALTGSDIAIPSSELKPTAEDEWYWHDLIGLTVVDSDGEMLGTIDNMMATGANDVMVLTPGQLLIPFVQPDVVKAVDLEAGRLTVDWSPDWL